MDPIMYSVIASQQLSEYFEELDRERQLRRQVGHRKAPRHRFSFLRLRRSQPKAHPTCQESTATEAS